MPTATNERIAVYEWLMWQMGGFGPMLGQAHHFNYYAPEKVDYAMKRYSVEANRLYGVLTDVWRRQNMSLGKSILLLI